MVRPAVFPGHEADFTMDDSLAVPTGDERLWAMGCHLAGFLGHVLPIPGMSVVGPLVIWLARRDESVFVADQGRRAVNFQITMALMYLFSWPLVPLLGLGLLTMMIVVVVDIAFMIIAAIRSSAGEAYHYPFTMDLVKPDLLRR